MIKGLIFDMDGVLFDTESRYIEKRKQFFNQMKVRYDETVLTELIGLKFTDCFEQICPQSDEACIERLKQEYQIFQYEKSDFFQSSIFPEVKDTLRLLYDQGYQLGLASSSPKEKVEDALESAGIRNFFTFCLSGNEFKHSKPNPDIYLVAADKMGYCKAEIAVIEDSQYGIQAAKKAGLLVVCRKESRYPVRQEGGDFYINTLDELPMLLDQISN